MEHLDFFWTCHSWCTPPWEYPNIQAENPCLIVAITGIKPANLQDPCTKSQDSLGF